MSVPQRVVSLLVEASTVYYTYLFAITGRHCLRCHYPCCAVFGQPSPIGSSGRLR